MINEILIVLKMFSPNRENFTGVTVKILWGGLALHKRKSFREVALFTPEKFYSKL